MQTLDINFYKRSNGFYFINHPYACILNSVMNLLQIRNELSEEQAEKMSCNFFNVINDNLDYLLGSNIPRFIEAFTDNNYYGRIYGEDIEITMKEWNLNRKYITSVQIEEPCLLFILRRGMKIGHMVVLEDYSYCDLKVIDDGIRTEFDMFYNLGHVPMHAFEKYDLIKNIDNI
jgi:hypothetical protein